MTRGFSSGAFFRRLDERELEERTARVFKDRPENLHDYQGCAKDNAGSDAGPSRLEEQPDEAVQPRVDTGPHPASLPLCTCGHYHPQDTGCPTSAAQMVPVTCDTCGKQIGHGWDAEYSRPQSIFRCADCYAKIGGAA